MAGAGMVKNPCPLFYANLLSTVLAGFIVGDQFVWLQRHVVVTQEMKEVILTLFAAYSALSIATSLTTTLLITLRILLVQRAARMVGAVGSGYGAVVEILVESAVFYSAALLALVVFSSRRDVNLYYAQSIHAQTAVR